MLISLKLSCYENLFQRKFMLLKILQKNHQVLPCTQPPEFSETSRAISEAKFLNSKQLYCATRQPYVT